MLSKHVAHSNFAGPDMPKALAFASMAPGIGGSNSLILSGGYDGSRQSKLYELKCRKGECAWTTLPMELEVARDRHVSFLIPDSMVTCTTTTA